MGIFYAVENHDLSNMFYEIIHTLLILNSIGPFLGFCFTLRLSPVLACQFWNLKCTLVGRLLGLPGKIVMEAMSWDTKKANENFRWHGLCGLVHGISKCSAFASSISSVYLLLYQFIFLTYGLQAQVMREAGMLKVFTLGSRKGERTVSFPAVAGLEASEAPGRWLEIQNCHLSSDTWNRYLHVNKTSN